MCAINACMPSNGKTRKIINGERNDRVKKKYVCAISGKCLDEF